MNPSDYPRWKLEQDLVENLLSRVESVERTILVELGCSTDPVAVSEVLSGEKQPPWPRRTAKRSQQRALHAMHTLAFVAQTRHALAIGAENPRDAARWALLAGLHAGDGALSAVQRSKAKGRGVLEARDTAEKKRKKRSEIGIEIEAWKQKNPSKKNTDAVRAYLRRVRPQKWQSASDKERRNMVAALIRRLERESAKNT
jgi:hypothetical protein